MSSKKHQEEGNQSGNKDNMDEVHLEGEHIKLQEKGKKVDIAVKKIDPRNVARKGTLLENAILLKWKVI